MLTRAIIFFVAVCSATLAVGQHTSVIVKVFLEGPYTHDSGTMRTTLHKLGYLPGMQPSTFFATPVSDNDPYNSFGVKKVSRVDVSMYSPKSVDWIQITIANELGDLEWTRTALLESDGTIVFDGDDNLTLEKDQKYRITLRHRNHLAVQSPYVALEEGQLSFDFTTDQVSGVKKVGDVYTVRGGQLDRLASNQSVINSSDIENWSYTNGKNSSYLRADINMDGDVSVHDKSIILSNMAATSTVK